MNTFSNVPPGFRFHPTDEELVDYYLRKKVASKSIDLDVIKDIDLYKIEPWDLQELCKIGAEEQNEWYFFSHKDKKYPTGTRTNRATKAGFWKATGRDKSIYTKQLLIGMRKTLVFYRGRAPNGQKSDWIMHEYRLETNEIGTPQEERWVVCRVFKKRMPTMRDMSTGHGSPCWYDDQTSYMPEFDSPSEASQPYLPYVHHFPCKQELYQLQYTMSYDPFLQLPQFKSPKLPAASCSLIHTDDYNATDERLQQTQKQNLHSLNRNSNNEPDAGGDQVIDWRVLDKFVASQLSHENASETTCIPDVAAFHDSEQMNSLLLREFKSAETIKEHTTTSTSSCLINPWK